MLDKNKVEVIVAGPGVGKTTELLNRVEKALEEGAHPMEIAFFSFSTTAVNEGLTRLTKRMEYKKSQFKYFKTLHSMAFSMLGLNTRQVVSFDQLRTFAKENDMKLPSIDFRTGNKKYQTKDMQLMGYIDSARLLGLSMRDYMIKFNIEDITVAHAEDIANKYAQFKLTHGVVDFTDMIILANKNEFETPYFKYMFIDEAQDLSTQQWMFVEKLAQHADNVVVVGDERQAIADFAGADIDYFLNIEGKMTQLKQSYRVPAKIYNLARKVEKHMKKTRGLDWIPRPKEFGETTGGEIIRVADIPLREMSRGSWLVLTRTNAQLTDFKNYFLKACDILPAYFTVDGEPPMDPDIFKAIQMFEAMTMLPGITKYDFITIDEDDDAEKKKRKEQFIRLFKRYMSSKEPYTAELDSLFMHRFSYRNWWDAFDKMPILEKKYVKAMYQGYKKDPMVFDKAKIKLSTIHSSKGMEADNVLLFTTLTGRVYKEWQSMKDKIDTEEKVLFVAITRAKKRLFLLGDPKARYSYESILH